MTLPDPTKLALVAADDPILRTPAARVTDIAEQVAPYIYEMKRIMREHAGIGLAAPQVGIPFRFFLMEYNGCRLVINPRVTSHSGPRISGSEGCLSFPGRTTYVPRWDQVNVAWNGSQGEVRTMTLRGRPARIFQHEADHLDGICIFQ